MTSDLSGQVQVVLSADVNTYNLNGYMCVSFNLFS